MQVLLRDVTHLSTILTWNDAVEGNICGIVLCYVIGMHISHAFRFTVKTAKVQILMNNNSLINNVSRVKAKCLRLSDAFLAIYQQDLKFRGYLGTEIDHKTPHLSVPGSFTSLIQPPEPSKTEL